MLLLNQQLRTKIIFIVLSCLFGVLSTTPIQQTNAASMLSNDALTQKA